jgi:peptide/nickel transport system substrate-binding protein
MADGFTRRHVLIGGMTLTTASAPGVFTTVPSAEAAEQIDSITWALPSIPDKLFIPNAWTTYTGAIMSLVQGGLLTFGDDYALIPAAGEMVPVDSTTIKYHLQSGVTFGDGSPLTAEDVVATFKYHMNPDSGSQLASFYTPVKTVEATAANEVTVILKEPNVQFRYAAAHMAGFIFKKEQLADKNIGSAQVLPLGTGPYTLSEFVPNEHVTLEAREDYWGKPKPVVKRITIQAPDREHRYLAMKSGAIDGAFDLAMSDVNPWKALGNVDIVTTPSLGVYVLTLDHSEAPFDNIHFRRAVSYAVDREGLVEALLKGHGRAATALNPPEMWSGVLTQDEVRNFYATFQSDYSFDKEKAKEELEKAGYPHGYDKTITILASNTDPYMVNIMQSVVEKLRQIGIPAELEQRTNDDWLAQYFAHEKLGMQIMAYYPDFADPANYPYLFFSSATAVKDGMNASNFKNDEVDKCLKTANEKDDKQTRADALKRVFKIAEEDVALVPIFWPDSAMAINKKYRLTGYNAFWYSVPWALRLSLR